MERKPVVSENCSVKSKSDKNKFTSFGGKINYVMGEIFNF
jgi:hypothetical protein